jgi:hypothetical protein
MSKGQRGNRELKKPKQNKPKTAPVVTTMGAAKNGLMAQIKKKR